MSRFFDAYGACRMVQVLDATKSEHHKVILTRELEAVGLRLNCGPPQIYYKKNKTGGISFSSTVPLTHLDQNLVSHILHGARSSSIAS